jgi:hypothetical protein
VAETLRERVAPWVPYWPWVVVPGLIVALVAVSAQSSAQARKLALVQDDVEALEQQVAVLKKTRSAHVTGAGATPFLLPPAASATRVAGGRSTAAGAPAARRAPAEHTPRAGGGAGKAGKRGKRAQNDDP